MAKYPVCAIALLIASQSFASEWESRDEGAEDRSNQTVTEVIMEDERFTTFAMLWRQAGMMDELAGEGEYTVLAPTDAAFERLPDATLASLTEPEGQLRNLVRYHVLNEFLTSESMIGDEVQRQALNGQTLRILASFQMVEVNDADVHYPNIVTRNGIIHGIDTVLIPAAQ